MLNFASNFVENHSQNRCRICLSPNTFGLFKTPCDCSGTIGFVHQACLRRWMNTVRNFNTCEICLERYEFTVQGPCFKTLLLTFLRRPFFKFCKFLIMFLLAYFAMNTAFVASFMLTKIFLDLNFINEDTSSYVLIAIGFYSTFLCCFFCCFIISKAINSFQDFRLTVKEWWNSFTTARENRQTWTASQMSFQRINELNQPIDSIWSASTPHVSFGSISVFNSDSSSSGSSSVTSWQRRSEESRLAVLWRRTE